MTSVVRVPPGYRGTPITTGLTHRRVAYGNRSDTNISNLRLNTDYRGSINFTKTGFMLGVALQRAVIVKLGENRLHGVTRSFITSFLSAKHCL